MPIKIKFAETKPTVWEPNTIYYVPNGDFADQYVTSNGGIPKLVSSQDNMAVFMASHVEGYVGRFKVYDSTIVVVPKNECPGLGDGALFFKPLTFAGDAVEINGFNITEDETNYTLVYEQPWTGELQVSRYAYDYSDNYLPMM